MAAKSRVGCKCRVAAVLLLLLASVAALIAVTVIQDSWKSKEYGMEYGIVIDSGSSRSNVYLYEWPGNKENDTGVVREVTNCRVQADPISAMKVDPDQDAAILSAFNACMDSVAALIPAHKHKATPVFLGATAGMRMLQEEDEQRSYQVMDTLRRYLSSLPFSFQNASILSGQEEGLYGWITVNYAMGNFLEKNLWNAYIRPEGEKTVGSMDLGGASTQIAFAVPEDLRGDDFLAVRLYGYPYNVYTHSFLCYGKNEAEKRVLDKVIQASPNKTHIHNPCYPEGFSTTLNVSTIYDTVCTKRPSDIDPQQQVVMVGGHDSDKCRDIVRSIFDFSDCAAGNCSFNGVAQPAVRGGFLAYAGFFYSARALLLAGTSDLDTFNATIRDFCHTNWTTLRAGRQWISDRYLKGYCTSGHYIFTLLTDGYKFDTDKWQHISFQKEANNISIGWSLGFMLHSSNMIPSEVKEVFPLTNPLFAGLVFLFSALTIVTLVFIFIIIVRVCY